MTAFVPMKHRDIVTPVWSIEDLPTLKHSLGKAKVDRVRQIYTPPTTSTSNRTRYLPNTCMKFMQHIRPNAGGPVDDIIAGIARLDHGNERPLSTTRLHGLLQGIAVFSTPLLMDTLSVDKKQAQRYLLALKLCVKHIQRHADTFPPSMDEDDFILGGFTVSVIQGDI